mmetsp:Transcript_8298/g.11406  ORF Transcript_8298/g.11406 Transcript_8298/m.11406 type:complete len:120 (-) Transcript_8298:118-477(-)|eukprot:CAMPEP_0185281298 /NCGR_PEP_ID=MMETSP1359-20130426/66637_1 /TAXON_ID=552665 /ORGANISM="Bigelowiella longifila, Strain CCMP242" /LENGTH=119 /DNA_ID=CAMNT_0027876719 /DNA_START=223 /DNA_END=585 /DNA_ORIENTATION=+
MKGGGCIGGFWVRSLLASGSAGTLTEEQRFVPELDPCFGPRFPLYLRSLSKAEVELPLRLLIPPEEDISESLDRLDEFVVLRARASGEPLDAASTSEILVVAFVRFDGNRDVRCGSAAL